MLWIQPSKAAILIHLPVSFCQSYSGSPSRVQLRPPPASIPTKVKLPSDSSVIRGPPEQKTKIDIFLCPEKEEEEVGEEVEEQDEEVKEEEVYCLN